MLYQPIHTLTNSLNNYLTSRFNLTGVKAPALCPVINQYGSIPEHVLNKVVPTLVKLEQHKNSRN